MTSGESAVSDTHSTAHPMLRNLQVIASAPDGVQQLRRAILQSAVRGRLVPQDPSEESASVLLEQINAEKQRLYQAGKIRKPKKLPSVEPEEAPFEIPSTWEWTRLGKIGSIVGGGTPKTKVSKFWTDEGVPWLTPADLRDLSGKYIGRGRRDISVEGLEGSSAQLLPAGSVLFSSRAPIGYVAIAEQDLATNQGFKSCVPYLPDLNQYLYWFLIAAAPEIDRQAPSTTFREVSGKIVSRIRLPLPPLEEQRRISAKLDQLMALCDELVEGQKRRAQKRTRLNKAALHRLSSASADEELTNHWSRVRENFALLYDVPDTVPDLRQAILQLAVSGKLVPQDASDEPATVLKDRVHEIWRENYEAKPRIRRKDLPPADRTDLKFPIPPSWTVIRLGMAAEIIRGITFPASAKSEVKESGMVACLRTSNVQEAIDWDDLLYVSEDFVKRDGQWLQEHDLVISMANSLELVGKLAPVERRPERVTFGGFLSVIRPVEIDPHFFLLLLRSPAIHRSLQSTATRTTNIANLSLKGIRPLTLPLPPLNEQQRIVSRVRELLHLCDDLADRLKGKQEKAKRLGQAVAARVGQA
jgi:type I restriction enzyme S subunit